MTATWKRFFAAWALALAGAGGAVAAHAADGAETGDPVAAPLPAGAVMRLGDTFLRHVGMVGAVAVSSDGKRVASAGRDGSLYVWDVATGRRLLHFQIDANPSDMVFAADGNSLSCAYASGNVTVLSLQGAREKRTLSAGQGGRFARFSRDGTIMVSGGPGGVAALRLADGNDLGSVESMGQPTGLVVGPKGDFFVTCSLNPGVVGYVVKRWDLPSLKPRWETTSTQYIGMAPQAVSPDGQLLAAATNDGNVVLLDANTGLRESSFPTESRYVQWLQFLSNGRLVGQTEEGIRIWDANSGKQLVKIESVAGAIYGLAASRDGSVVATAGPWSRVGLWNGQTGQPLFNFRGHAGPVSSVSFAEGAGEVVSASVDGTVRRWHLADGNDTLLVRLKNNQSQWLAVAPGGRLAASRSYNHRAVVTVWDLAKGSPVMNMETANADQVMSAAFSPDGQLLATGGYYAIRIWHVASGRLFRQIDTGSYAFPVQTASLAFSADGKLLAAGGSGIRLYELATGLEAAKVNATASRGGSLAFSPDSRRLLVGAPDCPFYDLCTLSQVGSLSDADADEEDEEGVPASAVAFSPDGRKVATAGDDALITIWNAPRPAPAPTVRAASPQAPSTNSGQAPSTGPGQSQPADANQLAELWDLLASEDAEKAYQAAGRLVLEGPAAATFLGAKLKPIAPATQPANVEKLLGDLDSDNYRLRDEASGKLAMIADARRFQEALAKTSSDEVRARLGELLANLANPAIKDPQELRGSRAVRVLEILGDAAATEVLSHLAAGGAGRLTRDAGAALGRIKAAANGAGPTTRP